MSSAESDASTRPPGPQPIAADRPARKDGPAELRPPAPEPAPLDGGRQNERF